MTDPPCERTLLTTVLIGALLPPGVPEGDMLRSWLDSWSGVGHILDTMTAAGYHTELRQSVFGWRAEFYRAAMQHSRSTWAGVGTDVLPWRAVQMGALDVPAALAGSTSVAQDQRRRAPRHSDSARSADLET